MKLKYYTATAVERLRDTVAKRLDWYYDPQGDAGETLLTAADAVRESRLEAQSIREKLVLPDDVPKGDGGNPTGTADAASALAVYEALKNLTPQQAADERLWTYLCHMEYPRYVARRWLTSRPESNDDAARKVRNHFFARGNRPLIRDNALSRLWWLGSIAHEVEADAPHEFLERLLHRQDVRSALIERPSVASSCWMRCPRSRWRNCWRRKPGEPFRRWRRGMADNLRPSDRARCMSRIRSRHMRPERIVRSIVHRMGYRFRLHRRDLPGAPDLVLPRYQAVIFVHGCFWHWHADPRCPIATLPKSNLGYWRPKLTRTRHRDRNNATVLERSGWRVLTVWECQLRDLDQVMSSVYAFLACRQEQRERG